MMRALLMALSLVALTACGGSAEEKAQDSAKALADEQNALVESINRRGVPTIYWSEADLTDLEQDLNRLAVVESALRNHDGQNGVSIFGGNNQDFIAQRRANVQEIRRRKRQESAVAESPSRPPQNEDELARLDPEIEAAYETSRDELFEVHTPDLTPDTLRDLDDETLVDLLAQAESLMVSASAFEEDVTRVIRRLRLQKWSLNARQRDLVDDLIAVYELVLIRPGLDKTRAQILMVYVQAVQQERKTAQAQSSKSYSEPFVGPR